MTEPPADAWPTPDGDTALLNGGRDTLVGAPPPPVAPGPPAPGGPPPDRRIGAGMLLALGALLLVAAGIAIAWFATHRDSKKQVTTVVVKAPRTTPPAVAKVAVPRVVGLKEQVALVRLAQVGLRPKEVYKPTKQPKGLVVSQKPVEARNVKKGSQVTIVIDSGAPKVAVPDVRGKSFADARAALDKLGLDSTVTQVTSTQPSGTVVDMAPKPGAKLAKGSAVTLAVSKQATTTTPQTTTEPATTTQPATTTTTAATTPVQPSTANVPDVGGQDEASAAQAFGQAGIRASIVFVPGTDPLGTVEAQAKAAGTTVPTRSHVQINVSSGPGDKPKVPVPSVMGRTLKQALAALNAAHLRLIYLKIPVTSQSQAGTVVEQSPLGGSAPQNAQVLVFLGALQK